MHNVLAIFKVDLRHLWNNVIAAIVAVGLVLVPPMYAWFTTLGFWDPYSNTGGLEVAVANNDEGYTSDLLPTKIDAGEQIVSGLRANDQFHWEFTGEEDAVDGVRSGRYYAAIVIPKEFSRDLMSVFTPDMATSEIVYYTNEKLNAIAPRITNTGASTLQEQIDQSFAETVADVLLESTSNLTGYMDKSGLVGYAETLQKRLSDTASLMHEASLEAGTFADIVGSVASLVEQSTQILSGIGSAEDGTSSMIGEARSAIEGAHAKLKEAADRLNSEVDGALPDLETEASDAGEALDGLGKDVKDGVEKAGRGLGADPLSTEGIWRPDGALQEYKPVQEEMDSARAALERLRDKYRDELEGAANDIDSSLEGVLSKASAMEGRLQDATGSLSSQTSATVGELRSIEGSLRDTSQMLGASSAQLSKTSSELRAALDDNQLDEVRRIIGNDPETLASFLSAPTELVKHPVYEMPNNGSAMSPFYSSLALWIGAIFLVALTSTEVSKKRREQLDDPRPWQMYLGRYMVFGMLALLQAVVLCLGNVFFLGVECQHFWLYLLACCVTAIVFSNIVYTLTCSFGNIGKAMAIILLVMQLAGAGGIFPVQMSAPLFQEIYPWLPFSHSMEAFESAMAGIYGMQYWLSIGRLTALIAPMLLLGLVLRRPVIRMNEYINKKLDETKLV